MKLVSNKGITNLIFQVSLILVVKLTDAVKVPKIFQKRQDIIFPSSPTTVYDCNDYVAYGYYGQCMQLYNCYLVNTDYYPYIPVCKDGKSVCCPVALIPTTQAPTTPAPFQSCAAVSLKYMQQQAIGKRKKRHELVRKVVSGKDDAYAAHPYTVALFKEFNSVRDKNLFCGATFVAPNKLISAAHCFIDLGIFTGKSMDGKDVKISLPSGGTNIIAVLGDWNIKDPNDGARPVEVYADTIIIHKEYSYPLVYNDIAIITLRTNVTYNAANSIYPACLPGNGIVGLTLTGYTSYLTGWGHLQYQGRWATTLQVASLPIVDNAKCSELYASPETLPQGVNNRLICAGTSRNGDSGADIPDACQGDSGGPLVISDWTSTGPRFILVGVVASGTECGSVPGLYSKVSYFMPWLSDYIK